jgi:hypothetical protein
LDLEKSGNPGSRFDNVLIAVSTSSFNFFFQTVSRAKKLGGAAAFWRNGGEALRPKKTQTKKNQQQTKKSSANIVAKVLLRRQLKETDDKLPSVASFLTT